MLCNREDPKWLPPHLDSHHICINDSGNVYQQAILFVFIRQIQWKILCSILSNKAIKTPFKIDVGNSPVARDL